MERCKTKVKPTDLQIWGLDLTYLVLTHNEEPYCKAEGKVIAELEKNEAIDKKLLRYLSVKVKSFDLNTNYFSKKDDIEKSEKKERLDN